MGFEANPKRPDETGKSERSERQRGWPAAAEEQSDGGAEIPLAAFNSVIIFVMQ